MLHCKYVKHSYKKSKLIEMYILNIEVYYINTTKNPSTGTVSKTALLLQPEILQVFRNSASCLKESKNIWKHI